LLYSGFDRSAHLLEIITVLNAQNEETVIHAMKATKEVVKEWSKWQR
jgi:hypothetical protein